jgi:Xaa-Pro aminopeptidase
MSLLARRDKIRRSFKKFQIDAFLVTNPINVRYLTGFTGGDSFLLIKTDGDVLLSDGRFTIQIEEECVNLESYIRPNGETLYKAVSKQLPKSGCSLGIESNHLTIEVWKKMSDAIPNSKLVPVSDTVENLRQVKDRDEVKQIGFAVDAAYFAFNDIRKIIKKDYREIDVRNELEFIMRLHGAEEKSFSSIIGAGARAALPHGVPSAAKVGVCSHLLIDWGAIVNGYMSDLTRVLILSPQDKKLRKIYNLVLTAQEAAIAAIKPGIPCREIDAVARGIIKDAGYGKYFNHGLGHSFGLEIHENPRFRIDSDAILTPGMVMTVEPGIYIKGWGGIRIEDDVLVTTTGRRVLSANVPKSFDEMVCLL